MPSSKAIWFGRGVALLFIAFCFSQAFRAGRADGVRSEPGAAQASQPATAKLQLVSTPAAERRQLRTVPIRDLHPGMRVLAENPELTGDRLPDAEVTAADWRLIGLQMQKPDGGLLDIELLRPVEWLLAETLLRIESEDDLSLLLPRPLTVAVAGAPLADMLLGRTIELDLPELGAEGPATVLAIRPCPEVETANHAGRRLITGTFHHSAGNVLKLEIEDAAGPIGVTSNHPFWSADRQAFVEAGQLQVGEQLQQADGTLVQITRITPHTGPPVEVYNLEVDAEHVYHVGVGGVLVHNTYPYSTPALLGPNGVQGVMGQMNLNAQQALQRFRAMRQSIKGTISPDRQSAKALAEEIGDLLSISKRLRGPEQHAGGLFHYHLQEFSEFHFWFNGAP